MRVRSGQGYGKGQALGKVEGGFSNCLWRGAALSITDGLRLILLCQYLDVVATSDCSKGF